MQCSNNMKQMASLSERNVGQQEALLVLAQRLILEVDSEGIRSQCFDRAIRIVKHCKAVAGIDGRADELATQVLVEREPFVDDITIGG